MSINVGATAQVKFQNNVELALQQHDSKLINCVTTQNETGAEKVKVLDLVGNNAPKETTARHGDTEYNATPHDGVWIPIKPELYFADLVDNHDKLQTGIDVQGSYVKSGAGTVARAKDQRILQGFYGSIYSGKDGATTTPFPAGQILPVTIGGASGAQRMNVAKLKAANKMLAKGYADMDEPRFMVLTAEQNDDLLSEVPATSADFARSFQGSVNAAGQLTGMLGFTFIQMELANTLLGDVSTLSVDGSGYRKTPFWTKSGLCANIWQALRTMIDVLPQKRGSVQVYAGTTLAATRTEAGKCGIILNSEA